MRSSDNITTSGLKADVIFEFSAPVSHKDVVISGTRHHFWRILRANYSDFVMVVGGSRRQHEHKVVLLFSTVQLRHIIIIIIIITFYTHV